MYSGIRRADLFSVFFGGNREKRDIIIPNLALGTRLYSLLRDYRIIN